MTTARNRNYRLIAYIYLALVSTGCNADESIKEKCAYGAKEAQVSEYASALESWRKLAYDVTHKEWLRTARECALVTGLVKDRKQFTAWLTSVAKDNSDAMIMLAIMYLNGDDFGKDEKKAIEYLVKAKEANNPQAEKLLAILKDRNRGQTEGRKTR